MALEVSLRLEAGAPRRAARVAACGGHAWSAAEFGVTHADGIKRLVLLVLAAVHARAATVAPARLQCGSGTGAPLTACIGRLVPPTFCSQVTPLTRACPASSAAWLLRMLVLARRGPAWAWPVTSTLAWGSAWARKESSQVRPW